MAHHTLRNRKVVVQTIRQYGKVNEEWLRMHLEARLNMHRAKVNGTLADLIGSGDVVHVTVDGERFLKLREDK